MQVSTKYTAWYLRYESLKSYENYSFQYVNAC